MSIRRGLAQALRALLMLAVALPAWAGTTGQLQVRVYDTAAQPVGSASVELFGLDGGGAQARGSDARGGALFALVPAGTYRVNVAKPGFLAVTLDEVTVRENRTTTEDVTLFPDLGQGGYVETESTSLVTKEYLQNIPVGRSYQTAVTTVPGVQAGGRGNPSMGGGAFNENTYMLDGAQIRPPDPAPPPAVSVQAPPPEAPAVATDARPARMVHHDGWVALSVPNPRATLDAVVAIAEGADGRVEQMSGDTVSVRVPVAKFKELWQQVLGLGEALDQLVRAADVTDQYTALDLRARVLTATRARLIALLAQARTEEEKLRLLFEITRVTEELDTIDAQLRTLSDLASMSRISVQAVPREAFSAAGARPEAAGLEWIPALGPFRRGIWLDPHRVDLPTPAKMVALSKRGPLVAESSGGTVWWTLRVDNDPVGTASFWIDSVADRLAGDFADPVRRRLGSWECLALHEPGTETPYRWEICVETRGNKVHVSQSYFPDAEQLLRYGPAVDRVLSGAEGGA